MAGVWELFNSLSTTDSAKTDLGYVVGVGQVQLYSTGEILLIDTGSYSSAVFVQNGAISQAAPSGQLTNEDL